jgi:hypothetical protein
MIVKQQVLELVSFKLAPGSSEVEMLAASGICQSEFLQKQEGFLLRLTARRDDGSYVDVVLWESQAHADVALERSQSSSAAAQFLAHILMDPENAEPKMEHCAVLRRAGHGA